MGARARDALKPTDWSPTLSPEGPRYRALADAIAEAVEDGALRDGDRLPPVRALAWSLHVTPGTVARAYHLAENRGLIDGQIGRGTFVRAKAAPPHRAEAPAVAPAVAAERATTAGEVADLRMMQAIDVGQDRVVTDALERMIARAGALPLTSYHRFGDDRAEREAAADWLADGGLPLRPDDTIFCSGAQHGLLAAMAATMGGGDAVALTEPLIHPGLKDCAWALGVRLEPVAADPETGLLPEALEQAAARLRPSAIILTANNQNPSLATMPLERRRAIAAIAAARRIPIIEDDVYGWTGGRPRAPSFPELAPELSWYVTSLSKCVAAGLRAGFVLCPPGEGARAARLMQGRSQHVSYLVSALAAELIRSGDAAKIVSEVSAETARRAETAQRLLGPIARAEGATLRVRDEVAMAWLELPEPWRASDFHRAALTAGVALTPAETFAVGRAPAPHALRISLSVAPRDVVTDALARLAEVLAAGPEPAGAPA